MHRLATFWRSTDAYRETLSLTVTLPDEPRIEVLGRNGGVLYYG